MKKNEEAGVIIEDASSQCNVPVIDLHGVSIGFAGHGKPVLDDVTFRVAEGETLVLIGPSGHGKSVLMKCMAGLRAPLGGEVRIYNQDLYKCSGDRRAVLLKDIGMLFQKNALFDSMTVVSNLVFPLKEAQKDLSDKEIEERARHYLDAVGLSHASRLFPDEISGGMQKRLGIARALVLHPRIIFYDDPTAGLDPITSRHIAELIGRLKTEMKTTAVIVTNDMNRAFQLADHMAMVVDGQVKLTGTVEQTRHTQDPRVRAFIAGEMRGIADL